MKGFFIAVKLNQFRTEEIYGYLEGGELKYKQFLHIPKCEMC